MPEHSTQHPIAEIIRAAADNPDVKVLERARFKAANSFVAERCRRGVVVDVEAADASARSPEAICVVALPFTYTVTGRVVSSDPAIELLSEPSRRIPADAERRTGITNAMLAGRGIDAEELDQAVGEAAIVVSYGAQGTRPLLERLCDRFAHVPWGCAKTQVPWREEGFEPRGLEALLTQHELFADTGRPAERCEAVLSLLARPFPKSGVPALAALLVVSRQPGFRVWAVGAPPSCRPILTSSGYAWNSGADGGRRGWFKDTAPEELASEQEFLTSFWFDGAVEPRIQTMDALNRFSERA